LAFSAEATTLLRLGAGLATLGTGVALLATRKKARTRGYSFQPYGGPLGAGAVLRLKF
jgi:hypothetical protein